MANVLAVIKALSIAVGQYSTFRTVYRAFKRRNRDEGKLLLARLQGLDLREKLVFDIGANIGSVSEVLLQLGARVVAIEPNVSLLPEIHARCSYHPKLTILPIAISSRTTISKFYISEFSGQSSFQQDWSDSKKAPREVYVPTLPFEELTQSFGEPAYVKIDVEGHELDVFLGMRRLVPLVSFEFHMDERRAAEAVRVLRRYAALGTFSANVILEGESGMYFPEWRAYPEFEKDFLELCELERSRKAPYGEVFVRAVAAVA